MLLLFWIGCACALSAAGCASTTAVRANTATGGLELRMFVRDQTGATALYQVNPDGSLNFGGGFDALVDHTTWTGQMTPQEIQELRELIESHHWLSANPVSTKQPPDMLYRVELRATETRKHFSVKGESLDMQPVRELLAHISLRRLEDDLKRLPQPSLQPATTAPQTRPQ